MLMRRAACRVYACTLPGFGPSEKSPQNYTTDLWKAYVRDFMVHIVGRPGIVAGNSIGGVIPANACADHPHIFDGIVLVNTAGSTETAWDPDNVPDKKPQAQIIVNVLGWSTFTYLQRGIRKQVRYPADAPPPSSSVARNIRSRGLPERAAGRVPGCIRHWRWIPRRQHRGLCASAEVRGCERDASGSVLYAAPACRPCCRLRAVGAACVRVSSGCVHAVGEVVPYAALQRRRLPERGDLPRLVRPLLPPGVPSPPLPVLGTHAWRGRRTPVLRACAPRHTPPPCAVRFHSDLVRRAGTLYPASRRLVVPASADRPAPPPFVRSRRMHASTPQPAVLLPTCRRRRPAPGRIPRQLRLHLHQSHSAPVRCSVVRCACCT